MILLAVAVIGFGLGSLYAIDLVSAQTDEIDQNQVEDEVSKTIRINLEDGISSSNDIR